MRLADGVLLCVDAAEGLMVVGERAIRQAVAENLPIVLCITKVRGWCGGLGARHGAGCMRMGRAVRQGVVGVAVMLPVCLHG